MWGFFLLFLLAAVIALAGFFVAVAVRRWATREEEVPSFTLQDLREMHARGQISEQEFSAMRAALLAQLGHAEAGPASNGATPDEPTP